MKAKKGISLIVLVITIIVIIILAAAVILTLNNNNPITSAGEAVTENDRAEVQSAVTLILSRMMADTKESVTLVPAKDGVIVGTTFQITGSTDKFVGEKVSGKYVVSDTAYSLVATDLGIDTATLAKYKIDANGLVTAK